MGSEVRDHEHPSGFDLEPLRPSGAGRDHPAASALKAAATGRVLSASVHTERNEGPTRCKPTISSNGRKQLISGTKKRRGERAKAAGLGNSRLPLMGLAWSSVGR
jgi:hypothetical protein